MKVTDQRDPEEPLWDPRKITHDVWRRIGVDPATLSSNIAGFTHLHGFKRYGGHDTLRTYASMCGPKSPQSATSNAEKPEPNSCRSRSRGARVCAIARHPTGPAINAT